MKKKRKMKGGRRDNDGKGTNISSRSSGFTSETSEKVCLCARPNYSQSAFACVRSTYIHTCACTCRAGWLTSIKLVAIDREKRSSGKLSGAFSATGFFIRPGRRTVSVRIAKLRFAPSTPEGRKQGGQGLECLTASS